MFVLGGKSIDTTSEHRLHGGWHLNVINCVRKMEGAALPRQCAGLDQSAYALFEEEGVAFGTFDQHIL